MNSILNGWQSNNDYIMMLKLLGQLSNLFSESKVPFIHYRLTENVFCKYFSATNLSRSDIAYDALYKGIGIGIKTFQLKKGDTSIEKVAEFNAVSPLLRSLKGKELARQVSEFRNQRILAANNICGATDNTYHIVGRKEGEMVIFNTPYDLIDIEKICDVESKKGISVKFNDGINEYTYNYSKSVLQKRFTVDSDNIVVPIDIIDDPFTLLETLFSDAYQIVETKPEHYESVVLPLYSNRGGRNVPIKSGLNQWNAKGRVRNPNEAYIPIPSIIHKQYPDFFPSKETPFNLHLPNKTILIAKVCQAKDKALMSNPNCDLGKWLLRDVMNIPVGKLVTIEDLDKLGFDSAVITKIDNNNFSLSISSSRRYSDYTSQNAME